MYLRMLIIIIFHFLYVGVIQYSYPFDHVIYSYMLIIVLGLLDVGDQLYLPFPIVILDARHGSHSRLCIPRRQDWRLPVPWKHGLHCEYP